jgi:hypothetical protein
MKKMLAFGILLIAQSLTAGIDDVRNKLEKAIYRGSSSSVYNLINFSPYKNQLLTRELEEHKKNNQNYKNVLLQDKRTFNFWSLGKGAASGLGCYKLFQFLNTNEGTTPIKVFAMSAMAGFAYLGITNTFEGLTHKLTVKGKIFERTHINTLLKNEIQKKNEKTNVEKPEDDKKAEYQHRPWAQHNKQ